MNERQIEIDLKKAIKLIKEKDADIISVSWIQRHLGVGYNYANEILEKLTNMEIVYKNNAHHWIVK